jgi:isoleucyl-tRNA synthetase
MSAPVIRGGDTPVTEAGVRDAVRHVINPLWNVWYFFSLYANADGYTAKARTDSHDPLDRYVLAKTRELVEQVTAEMDEYDISGAAEVIRSYLDALTNWYVRRSRDRFWSGDHDAFDTLHTVLETLCRVAAPLLPMVTEEIWRGLTGGRSVHLTDWPDPTTLPADHDLVAAMDAARDVCSAALSVRKTQGLRVRLPLRILTVATPDAERLRPFADLVADEVNVKAVEFTDQLGDYCEQVLTVVPRVLGPRLGKDVQRVIKAVKAGEWSLSDGQVRVAGIELHPEEYELKLVAADAEHSAPLPGGVGVVVLDTMVTPELAAEGLARDVVRVVQQARRDADLYVSDRITLLVDAPDQVVQAVETHREFITAEVLATGMEFGPVAVDGQAAGFAGEVGDGEAVRVRVTRT